MKELFKDLKIIELASVLAGPAVGQFFAELGATVIKIENKKTGGDVTRKWRLPTEDKKKPESAYFHSVNWGKESIFLDLKDAEDHQLAMDYIKTADVVIANFKMGSAQPLGMDYDTLNGINPRLIYANLTAYGEDNPSPGFDVLLQAETGFLYMNGAPNQPPVKMPVALIDLLAAHQLKEAILIALWQRTKTNKGEFITVSLAEAAIASLANQASNWLNEGYIPQRMGTQHPNIAPYGEIFKTKDQQEIILAIGTEKQFAELCNCLGKGDLVTDKRFVSNAQRVMHRAALQEALRPLFLKYKQATLLTRFQAAKVPAGVIRNMQEVFELPIAQGMILEAEKDGKISKRVRTVGFHFKSSIS
ncbi:MAG: CaiB/BaiF CoA transferase family protein [Saprospiraceae bacterium]